MFQAHFEKKGLGPLGTIARVLTLGEHGHLDVFNGAQRGQQIKGLKDESHLMGSVVIQVDGGAELRALKKDFAAGGGIESAQQLQQGGFAAAAGPADGHVFAGGDGKIDATQGLDAPFIVAFAQVARFQQRTSHA